MPNARIPSFLENGFTAHGNLPDFFNQLQLLRASYTHTHTHTHTHTSVKKKEKSLLASFTISLVLPLGQTSFGLLSGQSVVTGK